MVMLVALLLISSLLLVWKPSRTLILDFITGWILAG